MKRAVCVGALVAVVVAGAPSAEARQWGHRHWADTAIRVVDYGAAYAKQPEHWKRELRAALDAWESVSVLRFHSVVSDGPRCRGFTERRIGKIRRSFPDGQISVCKQTGGNPFVAGWTTAPPGPGGEIREAVVALRSANTACHEIGHALGLDHPTVAGEDDSCLGIGDWRYPGAEDVATLNSIYGGVA